VEEQRKAGAERRAVGCRTLADVLAAGPGKLAGIDTAEMNLLCAAGPAGAEGPDVGRCLARLHDWAGHVRRETERYLYRFRREPGEYDHSEGYFRMLMLVTVLQQDLGVHYNARKGVRNLLRTGRRFSLAFWPALGRVMPCPGHPGHWALWGQPLKY